MRLVHGFVYHFSDIHQALAVHIRILFASIESSFNKVVLGPVPFGKTFCISIAEGTARCFLIRYFICRAILNRIGDVTLRNEGL